MRFDDTLQNYYRQVPASSEVLGEAVLSDVLRGILKGEKANNMAEYTYRLENPKQNLKVLYDKFGFGNTVDKSKPLSVGQKVTGAGGKLTGSFQVIAYDPSTDMVTIQPLSKAGALYKGGKQTVHSRTELVESLIITEATSSARIEVFNPDGEIKNPSTQNCTL